MKELEHFIGILPKQIVLPGFQKHLGLSLETIEVNPSPRDLLEIICLQTRRTGKLPVAMELVWDLEKDAHVTPEEPLGEFCDEVANLVYVEGSQVEE